MLLLLLPHKHDCGQNEEKSKFWRPFRIFIVSEQITLAATQSCSTERGGLRKGYKHDISISARTFTSHLFDLSCIVLGKQTQPATRHKVNAQIKWKKVLVSGGLTSRRFSKKSIYATKTFERSRFTVSFRGTSRLGSAFFALRWFKLSHIYIQVAGLHQGDWVEFANEFNSVTLIETSYYAIRTCIYAKLICTKTVWNLKSV